MAKGYFIGLGDKTSCGGVVLDGDDNLIWYGMLHAREGDRVSCGKDGKIYQLIGGVRDFTRNGIPIAGSLDSFSSCACKAKLIPSQLMASYIKNIGVTNADTPKPTPVVCDHPDQLEQPATYIAEEMNRNLLHPTVAQIKQLLGYDVEQARREWQALPWYSKLSGQPNFKGVAMSKQAAAAALWASMVGQNRPWDHKPKLRAAFNRTIRHKHGQYEYFYDLWSNIHYGYIGIACGFSEDWLFEGAGIEQIGSDSWRKLKDWETMPGPRRSGGTEGWRAWDDAPDRLSIAIGVKLCKKYPNGGLSAAVLMNEVLSLTPAEWGEAARLHACYEPQPEGLS